jgi:hypothetical protein
VVENKFSTSPVTYGAVLPVPRSIGRQLQPLRERYAGNNLLLPLHITLIFPFHFAGDRGELQERLRQVSHAIPPFAVEVGGLGCFVEKRVIFLSVALSEALRRLHLRLREATKGKPRKCGLFRIKKGAAKPARCCFGGCGGDLPHPPDRLVEEPKTDYYFGSIKTIQLRESHFSFSDRSPGVIIIKPSPIFLTMPVSSKRPAPWLRRNLHLLPSKASSIASLPKMLITNAIVSSSVALGGNHF